LSNEQSPRQDLNVPIILAVPEVSDVFGVSRKTVHNARPWNSRQARAYRSSAERWRNGNAIKRREMIKLSP
jgi:hypothetical protein